VTKRIYAHLMVDHLRDAVAKLGKSAQALHRPTKGVAAK
jgi:hypothetical protein